MMQQTWKALADPVRREILDLLREEERTTGEICDAFDHLTRFGVLSHISVLKEAGLIRVERRGRERINRIDPEPLREAYEDWIRNYEVLWAGRLGRLKKLAERRHQEAIMTDDDALPVAKLVTFDIEQTIDLKASPSEVFRTLTQDVGEWWGHPHLHEDTRDVVLEAVPGGVMKQVTRDGGGNLMFTVQAVRRDRLLVLHGTMGMAKTLHMIVRFELEPTKGGTRLLLKHWAIGELTTEIRDGFIKGWGDLIGVRLRAYVETGKSLGVRGK